ncbi:MAG TPA: M50 family metallopeptidase [Kofleriaceae bacterium]|nr:M50 family metallopeptidase [Kofleriaceae bacterium]
MLSVIIVIASLQLALSASLLAAAFTARLCRMRVSRVSIGVGRALVVLHSGATRWQLGLVPLGGFLQIAGRDATDQIVSNDDPSAFQNRPVLLRVLPSLVIPVIFSFFAGVIMTASYAVWGVPATTQRAEIAGVVPGSPAERGGLAVGDEVIAINRAPVSASEVGPAIQAAGGEPVEITVRRGDSILNQEVTPAFVDGVARVGIQTRRMETSKEVSLIEAATKGFQFPLEYDQMILRALVEIYSDQQQADFGGPVRIVAEFEKREDLRLMLRFAAILFANLGLALLLPMPPYPGGKALMIVCGWRSRRQRPAQEARELGNASLPRGRFPRVLLAVFLGLGLMLVSFVIQVRSSPPQPFGLWDIGIAMLFVVLAVGVGPGWPRVWVILVNILLLEFWASALNAGMRDDLAMRIVGCGGAAAMLLVLALSPVRRWFHQECPACHMLGARPVWSRRHSFGCIRCGSCWTE